MYSSIENIAEYYIILPKNIDTDDFILKYNEFGNIQKEIHPLKDLRTISSEEYYNGILKSIDEDDSLSDDSKEKRKKTKEFNFKYYNSKHLRLINLKSNLNFISLSYHINNDFETVSAYLKNFIAWLSKNLITDITLWCRISDNETDNAGIYRSKLGIMMLDASIKFEDLEHIYSKGQEYNSEHDILDKWFKLYYALDYYKYLDYEYGYAEADLYVQQQLHLDCKNIREVCYKGHIEILKQKQIPPITSIFMSNYSKGFHIKTYTFIRPTPLIPLNKFGSWLEPNVFNKTFKLFSDNIYQLSLLIEKDKLLSELEELAPSLNEENTDYFNNLNELLREVTTKLVLSEKNITQTFCTIEH